MQPIDLTKLRRFALVVALILITYSIAGVKLDIPAKINPLGIPFIVQRPDFLSIGLALASLYCVIRYIYFAYLVQISPTSARQMLRKGSPVHAPTLGISVEEFAEKIADEMQRYFPSFKNLEASHEAWTEGNQGMIKTKIPKGVWILSVLEDIDYALPLIANIIALALWMAV